MFTSKVITVLVVAIAITFFTGNTLADDLCSTGSDAVWRRHPGNCSTLYMCVLGKAVTFQLCPEGQVVARDEKTCVLKGSALDDCTSKDVVAQQDNLIAPSSCKLGEKQANPTNCAKFSECVTMGKSSMATIDMECPYPLLFDISSGKCDYYKNAKCQPEQMVPKNPCDYQVNQCRSAHCVPCHIRFPSCTGSADGLNTWAGREWSPFFVMCENERVVYQGECKSDKDTQVFHPQLKSCVKYDNKYTH